jgi:hypothetical protein
MRVTSAVACAGTAEGVVETGAVPDMPDPATDRATSEAALPEFVGAAETIGLALAGVAIRGDARAGPTGVV